MVRRLELAQALVSAPRLLILDEPTIGLDPIARTGVWEHINAVREATGMTVLVTTHYMDEADQYCDRVALMHRGRIRALGTPAELREGLGERRRAEGAPPRTRCPAWRTSSGTSPAAASTSRQEISAMSEAPAAPLPRRLTAAARSDRPAAASAAPRTGWRVLPARVAAMCVVELQKLRHDRTELYTRAVQPALWLLIFGETFTRHPGDPHRRHPLPRLSWRPGIIAQSAMFIAIFYGIQIIWERDAGVLDQAAGHADPARRADHRQGVRRRGEGADPGGRRGGHRRAARRRADLEPAAGCSGSPSSSILGSAFFSCLSMTIAGIVLTRDRLMGIGQAITMPLFFGSNALYPVAVMPGWLQAVSQANPLSYEVDALRGLLLGTPAHLALDFGVLAVAAALGVTAASSLLGRLAR